MHCDLNLDLAYPAAHTVQADAPVPEVLPEVVVYPVPHEVQVASLTVEYEPAPQEVQPLVPLLVDPAYPAAHTVQADASVPEVLPAV